MLVFLTIFATATIAFVSPGLALLLVPVAAFVLTILSWRGQNVAISTAYKLDERFTKGLILQSYLNGLAACAAAFLLGSVMHVTMLVS